MEEYEVLKGKGNLEKRDRSLTRVTTSINEKMRFCSMKEIMLKLPTSVNFSIDYV